MDEQKPILAIETSQNLCSACVYFSNKKFFEVNFNLKHSHAEKLFEAIDFVINTAEIKMNDLNSIAVSAGPGSFTGLRIGMSAAKGLAFGASLSIIPVPTFEALALQISDCLPDNTEFIIANKVNVEEVYFAKFIINKNNYSFIEDLKILNKTELIDNFKDILIFGNALLDSDRENLKIKKNIISLTAKHIAKWGELFGKDLLTSNYDYLEPTYIKDFKVKERKK